MTIRKYGYIHGIKGEKYPVGRIVKIILGHFRRRSKISGAPILFNINDFNEMLEKNNIHLNRKSSDVALRGVIERELMNHETSKGFVTKAHRGRAIFYYVEYRFLRK